MLKVSNLTKVYDDIVSVDNISFEIKENEVVGLLGINGAGKTTTMKMLAGSLSQTAGEIYIDGQDAYENDIEARKKIGYLPEVPPLYMDMKVKEYLGFICDLRKIHKKDIKKEILRVSELLNVADVINRCIKYLSKGYKQRVGFAGAIIGTPKLLILDEPFVGLDPKQIIDMRSLIRDLSTKMTIILSSHILMEITSVCNRIIMIKNGKIIADGTPLQIEKQYSKEVKMEIIVKGDFQKAEQLLKDKFIDKICFAKNDEPIEDNQLKILISYPLDKDYREDVYQELAQYHNEISILTMNTINMTLEEIFIDINRLNSGQSR